MTGALRGGPGEWVIFCDRLEASLAPELVVNVSLPGKLDPLVFPPDGKR